MKRGEQCQCPEGVCVKGVDPAYACVFRLEGEVVTAQCEKCGRETWHMENGDCFTCYLPPLRDSSVVEQPPVKRKVEGSNPSPAAKPGDDDEASPFNLVVQVAGGKKFSVFEKRRVAAILKILLET